MKYYLLFIMLFAFANQTFGQNPPPPPPPDYVRDSPPPNVQELSEPDVNKVAIFDVAPEPLNMEEVKQKIGYPPVASKAGIEGQVILRLLIDEQGNYIRHTFVKSAHPILKMAIDEHADEFRFKPALRDGKVIKCWVTIPFYFKQEIEIKKKRWWRK